VAPPAGAVAAPRHPVGLVVKRVVDLFAGSVLLLVCSPVLAATALAVVVESGRPVFFIQWRAGKEGVPFRPLKLRTMLPAPPGGDASLSKDDPRITRLGRFLRRWSLDELPQLVNVVLGTMSLVGPRPTLIEQVQKYDAHQWERMLMKPGLTGWAQVNGRNSIDWHERIELDVIYVQRWSLLLDLKCVARTFTAVVSPVGVYGKDGVNRGF
jgi:lipopolysaccharide/colanic/teichoic acid biosynthesis glycosyltransferase